MAWPPQSRPPHVPPPRPRMPPVHPLPSSMPLRRPCIAATTTTTPSSQPHTPWFPPPKKLASQKHLRADHCQSKLELRGRSDHGRQSAPSHLRPLPGLAKMRPNLINFSLNSCLSGSFGKGNGPVRRQARHQQGRAIRNTPCTAYPNPHAYSAYPVWAPVYSRNTQPLCIKRRIGIRAKSVYPVRPKVRFLANTR